MESGGTYVREGVSKGKGTLWLIISLKHANAVDLAKAREETATAAQHH